jgi:hypothetical protein
MNITKYLYDKTVLTNEDANSYYILGAFISDGCISPTGKNTFSSTLVSKDKDWLEPIKNLFDPNIKIETPSNYYKLSINNKEIGDWFISKGCIPRKSLTVKMPDIPDIYLADFIRGVFDGDGSLIIYSDKRKIAKDFSSYICGSSIDLLNRIKEVLESKSIQSKIIEIFKKSKSYNKQGQEIIQRNKHWRLYFNKTQTLKFLSFIYYEGHLLRLERKLQTFNQMKNIYAQEQLTNNQLNKNCKILWPSDGELVELVKTHSYVQVGKMLGVSNVSVVERMKVRGIYIPRYKT